MWISRELWATLSVLRTANSCVTQLLSLELPLESPLYSTSKISPTSHLFRSLAGELLPEI